MAQDAGNNEMLVLASDGARSIGVLKPSGVRTTKTTLTISVTSTVPRPNPGLPGPGGHVLRKRLMSSFGFLYLAYDLSRSFGFMDRS